MKKNLSIRYQAAVWLAIITVILFAGSPASKVPGFYPSVLVRIGSLVLLYNLCYYVLMPIYFKGQKRAFFLWSILSFTCFLALMFSSDIAFGFTQKMAARMPTNAAFPPPAPWALALIPAALLGLIVFGVAASFAGISAYERKKLEEQEANRRRLEAELMLLKSQMNPHFLLNTLNNLYAIALTTPERTPDALLKLADMVRYILHECQYPKIALERDLQFIKNYIALQYLRLPPNILLRFTCPDPPLFGEIEPMLLIPFVENAFKHGLTTQSPCEIDIKVTLNEKNLVLKVENPVFHSKSSPTKETSGIGLAITRQRLEHAYPGKYQLHLENNQKTHLVELYLEL